MTAHAIMRGASMEPALREGMLLEVTRDVLPATGEIAVFHAGERIVAHRVVGRHNRQLLCCGDAQPDRIDTVQAAEIIGKVSAVFVRDGERMRRVDTPVFRARGYTIAYLHRVRRLLHRVVPGRREPTYRLLVEAVGAMIRADDTALIDAVEHAAPLRLSDFARRHRLAPALCAALEPFADNAYARATFERLRPLRWAAAAYMARYRAQVLKVAACLQSAGIEFVLLKGAARAFRRDEGWQLHESSDIDILVAQSALEGARSALQSMGYEHRCGAAEQLRYAERHHHAAPLFPREAGVNIELHRALHVSVLEQTTLERLRPLLIEARDSAQSALVLNRPGTALHYAIHCIDRPALRDVYLLAAQLAEMDAGERTALAVALTQAGVRHPAIGGALVIAAGMAGVPWAADHAASRFARWMLKREDLPRMLRAHTECVDAWLAAQGSPQRSFITAALERRTLRSALGRAIAAASTALYLALMR